MKLFGRLANDTEWTDLGNVSVDVHVNYFKGHGFKVKQQGTIYQLINPLTKKLEAEYQEVA